MYLIATTGCLVLPPSEILYSQDSIKDRFQDGRQLAYTFAEILYGRLDMNSLRPISCISSNGRIWAVSGNRRLYIMKKLQEAGIITATSVRTRRATKKQSTTGCGGNWIKCRGSSVDDDIQWLINEKRSGRSFRAAIAGLNGSNNAWSGSRSGWRSNYVYNDDDGDDDDDDDGDDNDDDDDDNDDEYCDDDGYADHPYWSAQYPKWRRQRRYEC